MARNVKVSIVLGLKNLATRGLAKLQAAFRNIGGYAKRYVKLGAAAAFTALGVAITKAVRAATSFQEIMAQVSTLIDADTAPAFANASEQILKMSEALPQTADDLGVGLYQTISAGVTDAADAFSVLEVAAKAAIAGGFGVNTETAVRTITGLLNAYQLGAEEASHISDVLFSTIKRGVVTFPDLAQNIGESATSAALAGVDLEELGAAMATMTKFGINAAESTTSLNRVFLALAGQTPKQAKAFKEIGVDFSVSAVKAKGLAAVLKDVADAGGEDIEVIKQLFPNIREFRAAMIIAGAGNKEFNKVLAEMRDNTGAAEAAFKKMIVQASNQWKLFKNRLNAVMIRFGGILLEQIVPALKEAGTVFSTLNERVVKNRDLIADFGSTLRVLVRFVVGLVPRIFDMVEAIGKLRSHMGPVITAWGDWIFKLRVFFTEAANVLMPILRDVADGVGRILVTAYRKAGEVVDEVRITLNYYKDELADVVHFIKTGVVPVMQWSIGAAADTIKFFLQGFREWGANVQIVWISIKEAFARIPIIVHRELAKAARGLSDFIQTATLAGGSVGRAFGQIATKGLDAFADATERRVVGAMRQAGYLLGTEADTAAGAVDLVTQKLVDLQVATEEEIPALRDVFTAVLEGMERTGTLAEQQTVKVQDAFTAIRPYIGDIGVDLDELQLALVKTDEHFAKLGKLPTAPELLSVFGAQIQAIGDLSEDEAEKLQGIMGKVGREWARSLSMQPVARTAQDALDAIRPHIADIGVDLSTLQLAATKTAERFDAMGVVPRPPELLSVFGAQLEQLGDLSTEEASKLYGLMDGVAANWAHSFEQRQQDVVQNVAATVGVPLARIGGDLNKLSDALIATEQHFAGLGDAVPTRVAVLQELQEQVLKFGVVAENEAGRVRSVFGSVADELIRKDVAASVDQAIAVVERGLAESGKVGQMQLGALHRNLQQMRGELIDAGVAAVREAADAGDVFELALRQVGTQADAARKQINDLLVLEEEAARRGLDLKPAPPAEPIKLKAEVEEKPELSNIEKLRAAGFVEGLMIPVEVTQITLADTAEVPLVRTELQLVPPEKIKLEKIPVELYPEVDLDEFRLQLAHVGLVLSEMFGGMQVTLDEKLDLMSSSVQTFAMGMVDAFEEGFSALITGSENAAAAFAGAMLSATADIASGLARFYMGKAIAALGEGLMGDPRGFAAAAKFFAAAAVFGALAGAFAGAAQGGGGGGGAGARTTEGEDQEAPKGEATIIVEGGFLDMNDPRQRRRMADALEQLSGRRVHIRGG